MKMSLSCVCLSYVFQHSLYSGMLGWLVGWSVSSCGLINMLCARKSMQINGDQNLVFYFYYDYVLFTGTLSGRTRKIAQHFFSKKKMNKPCGYLILFGMCAVDAAVFFIHSEPQVQRRLQTQSIIYGSIECVFEIAFSVTALSSFRS